MGRFWCGIPRKGLDMLKTLTPLLGALLLSATSALYAQTTPPADAGKGPHGRRFDCSQAKDPKACEAQRKEMREKMKAAHEKASKACESQKGGAHRDCMRKEMCAQAKDPAKCEARAKEHREKRKERREQNEKK
jgi:hypothetical protein